MYGTIEYVLLYVYLRDPVHVTMYLMMYVYVTIVVAHEDCGYSAVQRHHAVCLFSTHVCRM